MKLPLAASENRLKATEKAECHTPLSHITLFDPMSRAVGLLCRKGIFYLNLRVPKELVSDYDGRRFIRKSLRTSDYRMASRKAKRVKRWIDERVEAKRQWLEILKSKPKAKRRFSEEQQAEFVRRYFIEMERAFVSGLHKAGPSMEPEEVSDRISEVQETLAHYEGLTDAQGGLDLDALVEQACVENQLYVAFPRRKKEQFGSALARAQAESYHRLLQRLRGQSETARYPEFQGVSSTAPLSSLAVSHTQSAPPKESEPPSITLGELSDIYMKIISETRPKSTVRTYWTIVHVVQELLGKTPAVDFTFQQAKEFLESLLFLSPYFKQRFPGKPVREIMEMNKQTDDFERLSKKTLENYLTNFSAILNFGKCRGYIAQNPLSDKFVRDVITRIPENPKEPITYTVDELNRLFRAPLYTGCMNDETGVNRPGPNRPRRGRFWLPLLGLFHGFRLNEVAQLYTEDIKCENGIWYFFVRIDSDERGNDTTKQLKSKQSRRRVPIHPELKAIGFIEYVQERQKDRENPHLYTDARQAASGYYSDIMSKRYITFRNAALPDSLGGFHTFRHTFRDALREAGVENLEIIDALGGWKEGKSGSAQSKYGKGPSLQRLHEEISKVRYEGLDLSHLYVEN